MPFSVCRKILNQSVFLILPAQGLQPDNRIGDLCKRIIAGLISGSRKTVYWERKSVI
jgi:hypothetical protein